MESTSSRPLRPSGARSGVEVREIRGQRPEDDPRRPFYEANAFARDFYISELWEADRGAVARAYLERRGIPKETAERFGLGFAPDGWRHLREAALKHGLHEDVLLEVGLTKRGDRQPPEDPYDRLRNRLIFPINALGGKTVGFGGRVLDAKAKPKYLNSPETPLYHKSELLYGLDWAKNEIRRAKAIIVVEGYMDVVSLAAVGVKNVVAVLGTALTPQHAKLIKRFTTQVYLLFDSDRAGLRATFKNGDVLLSEGLHPSVITLPEGEDPDSVVREGGAAALQPYIEQAVDLLDRKIQILEEKDYFSSIDRKRRALDRLLTTLRSVADPTLRDMYISRVSTRTGVQRSTLESELSQPSPPTATPSKSQARPPRQRAPRTTSHRIRGMGAERQLLLLMIKDRTWIEQARAELRPDELDDQTYRAIYEMLLDNPELRHASPDVGELVRSRLEELLSDTTEMSEASRVFSESLARVRGTPVDRRLQALDDEIAEMQRSGDVERAQALLAEKQKISRERAEGELSSTDWRRASQNTLGREQRKRTDPRTNEGDYPQA